MSLAIVNHLEVHYYYYFFLFLLLITRLFSYNDHLHHHK